MGREIKEVARETKTEDRTMARFNQQGATFGSCGTAKRLAYKARKLLADGHQPAINAKGQRFLTIEGRHYVFPEDMQEPRCKKNASRLESQEIDLEYALRQAAEQASQAAVSAGLSEGEWDRIEEARRKGHRSHEWARARRKTATERRISAIKRLAEQIKRFDSGDLARLEGNWVGLGVDTRGGVNWMHIAAMIRSGAEYCIVAGAVSQKTLQASGRYA
jgi:hypothetical protein